MKTDTERERERNTSIKRDLSSFFFDYNLKNGDFSSSSSSSSSPFFSLPRYAYTLVASAHKCIHDVLRNHHIPREETVFFHKLYNRPDQYFSQRANGLTGPTHPDEGYPPYLSLARSLAVDVRLFYDLTHDRIKKDISLSLKTHRDSLSSRFQRLHDRYVFILDNNGTNRCTK